MKIHSASGEVLRYGPGTRPSQFFCGCTNYYQLYHNDSYTPSVFASSYLAPSPHKMSIFDSSLQYQRKTSANGSLTEVTRPKNWEDTKAYLCGSLLMSQCSCSCAASRQACNGSTPLSSFWKPPPASHQNSKFKNQTSMMPLLTNLSITKHKRHIID